jgi:hypothetical protein
MAHFAKLNFDNLVIEVLVVSNDDINNLPFPESEPLGIVFLETLLGVEEGITWKQTSYNGNFRKNYAGLGYTYDATRDAFIAPKPHPSWILDENTCIYDAPIEHPNDGFKYLWDEEQLKWIKYD